MMQYCNAYAFLVTQPYHEKNAYVHMYMISLSLCKICYL